MFASDCLNDKCQIFHKQNCSSQPCNQQQHPLIIGGAGVIERQRERGTNGKEGEGDVRKRAWNGKETVSVSWYHLSWSRLLHSLNTSWIAPSIEGGAIQGEILTRS